MRAADFLAAAAQLPVVDLDTLTHGRGLVVVAPHPDDESLGCGGVIAEACARGKSVRVVVVSDGAASHRNSLRFPADHLRLLRRDEARAAASILGVHPDAIAFLDLPDGGVPTTGDRADRAVEAIRNFAGECDAGAMLVTWEHDPHSDHVASNALTRRAHARCVGTDLYAYSIWGRKLRADLDVGPEPAGVRIDVARHRAAKRRAIMAHRSQTSRLINDDPTGFRLKPKMIDELSGNYETFLLQSIGPAT